MNSNIYYSVRCDKKVLMNPSKAHSSIMHKLPLPKYLHLTHSVLLPVFFKVNTTWIWEVRESTTEEISRPKVSIPVCGISTYPLKMSPKEVNNYKRTGQASLKKLTVKGGRGGKVGRLLQIEKD